MEYFRTKNGQIQADLSFRLGQILMQYTQQIKSEDKYEVTLCLAILQKLLTNCVELLNSMSKRARINNPFTMLLKNTNEWGFSLGSIKINTFKKESELTPEKVIRHIRNSLSHPTVVNLNSVP